MKYKLTYELNGQLKAKIETDVKIDAMRFASKWLKDDWNSIAHFTQMVEYAGFARNRTAVRNWRSQTFHPLNPGRQDYHRMTLILDHLILSEGKG